MPVPEHAPPPRFIHYVRGRPLETFEYRSLAGELLGYTCLFARDSGGYAMLPFTYCWHTDGREEWRWQQFSMGARGAELRPVYGLHHLDATPDAFIMIHFDEASAEVARRIFPEYVSLAFPGGPRKIGLVDWSDLKHCTGSVSIWPDHPGALWKLPPADPRNGTVMPLERQPNWRAAEHLAATLRGFGLTVWNVLKPAQGDPPKPDGWNIAQAVRDGWSDVMIRNYYMDHLGDSTPPSRFKVAPAEPVQGSKATGEVGGESSAAGGEGASTPSHAALGVDEEEAWLAVLNRQPGGLIKSRTTADALPESYNVRLYLENHPAWRGVIAMDEFAMRIVKRKPPPFQGGTVGEWLDTDDNQTLDWMAASAGINKLSINTVVRAVHTTAKLNACNPLRDHLRSLKWDGKPRLNTWLHDYLGAGPIRPDMSVADMERVERYHAIVGRMWLLGAVYRAFRPGCKFDYVLVLEGMQGLGKSGVPAVIGGEWSMDTPFDLSGKEGMENILGKWVVELAELDAFNKAESTTAKSFFTRRTDRLRLPYAKRSIDCKRACVFVGTTNEHEYFRDATGNRRYWPVACKRRGFDLAALQRDVPQLLAEAVAAFDAGERYWPSREEEIDYIRPQQDVRGVPDTWVGRIQWWIDEKWDQQGRLTVRKLLESALAIDPGRVDQHGHASRVGRALNALGYVKREDRTSADRFYYVKRQRSEEDDDE